MEVSAWGMVTGPRGVSRALINPAMTATPATMATAIRQSDHDFVNSSGIDNLLISVPLDGYKPIRRVGFVRTDAPQGGRQLPYIDTPLG
jgi:hypothetical protein